ncbi:LysR family transcriptional regulator [Cypionkella psychrotolerans]|uniref:LysR family transcriptional regulator n=1 Tax=Cypionkella psychrotolerans TaxID=1678131 RepID=UPI0006B61C73|nr:LysR family transcriptional regulator [Cypionkella psychrotolerans]
MALINIHFRHVRAFLTVAQERSYVRAAEKLFVSQPALSQTIRQFEDTVGFAVFERTTRSVSLTPLGAALLAHAERLSAQMDSFHAEIGTLQKTIKNELRVGYLIGTALEFIPDIVREFKQRHPESVLELTEYDFSDPTAGLASGKVDCSIVRPPLGIAGIAFVELSREHCVVCLPTWHRLADQSTVTLNDILDEPIIAAPGQSIWRDYWIASAHRGNRPANVVYEAATVESELHAVATGRGISITADSTARFYARPGVIFKQIVDMPHSVIAIGYREGANRRVRDFVSVVEALLRGKA